MDSPRVLYLRHMSHPLPASPGFTTHAKPRVPDAWIVPAQAWVEGSFIVWTDEPEECGKSAATGALCRRERHHRGSHSGDDSAKKVTWRDDPQRYQFIASAAGLLDALCALETAPTEGHREFVVEFGEPRLCGRHGRLPFHRTSTRLPCPPAGSPGRHPFPAEAVRISHVRRLASGLAAMRKLARLLKPTNPRPGGADLWNRVWSAFDVSTFDAGRAMHGALAWDIREASPQPATGPGGTQPLERAFDVPLQRWELSETINRLLREAGVHFGVEWAVRDLSAFPRVRVAAQGVLASAVHELAVEIAAATDVSDSRVCVICGSPIWTDRSNQRVCGDACRIRWRTQTQKDRRRRRQSHG